MSPMNPPTDGNRPQTDPATTMAASSASTLNHTNGNTTAAIYDTTAASAPGDTEMQVENTRRRWEELFDPEYTFEVDDIRGRRPARRKSLGISTERLSTSSLSLRPNTAHDSPLTEPILPRLDHLLKHIASHPQESVATGTVTAHTETNAVGGNHPIPPSSHIGVSEELGIESRPSQGWHEDDEKHRQRADLFNAIRNERLRNHNNKMSKSTLTGTVERLQQRLREKADKIKRDVHESDDDEGETSDLEDFGEKKAPDKKKCRRSFLYFVLGFLFPPVWLIGAFYQPSLQSTHAQRADMLWRRRSRIAFLIFLILLAVILFLAIVFKPGAIGWRNSSGNGIHMPVG